MSINNKIIVVDDDNIVLSALKMLLDLHGYENAVYFDDPKKALESIEKEAPDLILSDFMMPQMNGKKRSRVDAGCASSSSARMKSVPE